MRPNSNESAPPPRLLSSGGTSNTTSPSVENNTIIDRGVVSVLSQGFEAAHDNSPVRDSGLVTAVHHFGDSRLSNSLLANNTPIPESFDRIEPEVSYVNFSGIQYVFFVEPAFNVFSPDAPAPTEKEEQSLFALSISPSNSSMYDRFEYSIELPGPLEIYRGEEVLSDVVYNFDGTPKVERFFYSNGTLKSDGEAELLYMQADLALFYSGFELGDVEVIKEDGFYDIDGRPRIDRAPDNFLFTQAKAGDLFESDPEDVNNESVEPIAGEAPRTDTFVFSTGNVSLDVADSTREQVRVDNFGLTAGLYKNPVRGFLRTELSIEATSLIDQGLFVVNPGSQQRREYTVDGNGAFGSPSEGEKSTFLHSDFGIDGTSSDQRSTFSITVGEVKYGVFNCSECALTPNSIRVVADGSTVGTALESGRGAISITSPFLSTSFGGGETSAAFNTDGSLNGYASYLVFQNYTGIGDGFISGGNEHVLGDASQDLQYSSLTLATARGDSEFIETDKRGAVTLTGFVGGFSDTGQNINIVGKTEIKDGEIYDVPALEISISGDTATGVSASLSLDGNAEVINLGGEQGESALIDNNRFAASDGNVALISSEALFESSSDMPAEISNVSTYEHLQWGLFLGDIAAEEGSTAHVHMGSWVAGEVTGNQYFTTTEANNRGTATFTGHMLGNVSTASGQYTTSGTYQNEWTFAGDGTGTGNLKLTWDNETYNGKASGENAAFNGTFKSDTTSKAGGLGGQFYGPTADNQGGTFYINEQDATNPSYVASGTFAASCKKTNECGN